VQHGDLENLACTRRITGNGEPNKPFNSNQPFALGSLPPGSLPPGSLAQSGSSEGLIVAAGGTPVAQRNRHAPFKTIKTKLHKTGAGAAAATTKAASFGKSTSTLG
jgi:hypothetical protein